MNCFDPLLEHAHKQLSCLALTVCTALLNDAALERHVWGVARETRDGRNRHGTEPDAHPHRPRPDPARMANHWRIEH
jgi:hypothetical protein